MNAKLDKFRQFLNPARRRHAYSAFWSVIDVAITPILMLAATPVFLKNLGEVHYGLWMTITSITAVLGVVNFGGDATIRFLAASRAKNDHKEAESTIRTSALIALCICAILVALSFAVPKIIFDMGFFSIEKGQGQIFQSAMMFAMSVLGIKIFEQFLLAIPKGVQRFDLSTTLSCSSKLLTLAVQIALVVNGWSIDEMLAGTLVISTIVVMGEMYVLKLIFPGYKIITFDPLKIPDGYLRFAFWAWIYAAIGVLSTQADRLIVASFVDMKSLAYYAIASGVFIQFHSVLSAAASWVFPKVAGAESNLSNFSGLYYKMQLLIMCAGMTCLAILAVARDVLFPLWLGRNAWNETSAFMILFLALAAFELPTIVPYYFFRSSAMKANVAFKLGNIVANLAGMVIGFKFGGCEGMIVGRIVSPLAINTASRIYFHGQSFEGELHIWAAVLIAIPSVVWTLAFAAPTHKTTPIFIGVVGVSVACAVMAVLVGKMRTGRGYSA